MPERPVPIIADEQSPAEVSITGDVQRAGGGTSPHDRVAWQIEPRYEPEAGGNEVLITGIGRGEVRFSRQAFEADEVGREVEVEIWTGQPLDLEVEPDRSLSQTHIPEEVQEVVSDDTVKVFHARCLVTGTHSAETIGWPWTPDCRKVWGLD
ncbi:MAG: hypothetical protein HUU35_10415 [Armatimonadetes bacterium]|nr:hypothetical protein [Armatimonadota bacterium]